MARSKLCQKTWTGLVLPQNQPLNSSSTAGGPVENPADALDFVAVASRPRTST